MAKAGEVFGLPADDPFFDEEVGNISPIPNIPVTDAIAAAKAQQEQALVSKKETQVEDGQKETPVEELQEQQAVELADDTLITFQGEKRPWKEIQGLIQLKRDTDADKYRLNLEKQEFEKTRSFVESNLPFLSALEQSRFGVTLATSLRNGIPEEQAIAAAYAASGLTPPGSQKAQPTSDPEPDLPMDLDLTNPEHAVKAMRHQEWEFRQNASKLIEERVAPLQRKLDAYEEAIRVDAERQKAMQAEERKITEHNRSMLGQVPNYLKFKPEELTPEQQTAFWGKFDASAASLGIPSAGHRLSAAEIAGITSTAFPGGLNPFVQTQTKPLSVKPTAGFTTTKAPLGAGSGGGAPLGGNGFSLSDQDRIRNIMEGMAQGKPVEGVPNF